MNEKYIEPALSLIYLLKHLYFKEASEMSHACYKQNLLSVLRRNIPFHWRRIFRGNGI
jgi:hypothetical protein